MVIMLGQISQCPLLDVCHEQKSGDKKVINDFEGHSVVLGLGVSIFLLPSEGLVDEKFGMIAIFCGLKCSNRPLDITAYTLRFFVKFTASSCYRNADLILSAHSFPFEVLIKLDH